MAPRIRSPTFSSADSSTHDKPNLTIPRSPQAALPLRYMNSLRAFLNTLDEAAVAFAALAALGTNILSVKFSIIKSWKLFTKASFAVAPLDISLDTLANKVGWMIVCNAASVMFFAAQLTTLPDTLPTLDDATLPPTSAIPFKNAVLDNPLAMAVDVTFVNPFLANDVPTLLIPPAIPPVKANSVMKPNEPPIMFPILNALPVSLFNMSRACTFNE